MGVFYVQVNTDGLVLRGWYTSLTVAVYGTAERSHGHDQGSPPPPPPPPPQQPSGPKRIIKQGGHHYTKTALHSHFSHPFLKLKQSLVLFALLAIPSICCTVLFFLEWEKDDQYNGSPPRPAPRGPRTPPGPPPPDDDDEEQVQVTGQNCTSVLCMLHYATVV